MSVEFTVYNKETRAILWSGHCAKYDFLKQVQNSKQTILVGLGNDVTQKIEFDGFDMNRQPINPRIVDKTPEEIEADNLTPTPISFEKQTAHITNEQLQNILDRIKVLER